MSFDNGLDSEQDLKHFTALCKNILPFGCFITGEFIEEILEVAAVNPKAWENFTRPQQNSVCQWLEWLKVRTCMP